jgi:hypothetical protein
MLGEDLQDLIEAQGLGTSGTDLLVGGMPPSPDTVTTILETPGMAPSFVKGQALPAIEYPRVQIKQRGGPHDNIAPRLKLERIYQMLMARPAETLNGTKYLAWVPVQSPGVFERDENMRWVFVVNFEAWKEMTSL